MNFQEPEKSPLQFYRTDKLQEQYMYLVFFTNKRNVLSPSDIVDNHNQFRSPTFGTLKRPSWRQPRTSPPRTAAASSF